MVFLWLCKCLPEAKSMCTSSKGRSGPPSRDTTSPGTGDRPRNSWRSGLVVEPYPSEKYECVNWDEEIPNWVETSNSCSKPPTSLGLKPWTMNFNKDSCTGSNQHTCVGRAVKSHLLRLHVCCLINPLFGVDILSAATSCNVSTWVTSVMMAANASTLDVDWIAHWDFHPELCFDGTVASKVYSENDDQAGSFITFTWL